MIRCVNSIGIGELPELEEMAIVYPRSRDTIPSVLLPDVAYVEIYYVHRLVKWPWLPVKNTSAINSSEKSTFNDHHTWYKWVCFSINCQSSLKARLRISSTWSTPSATGTIRFTSPMIFWAASPAGWRMSCSIRSHPSCQSDSGASDPGARVKSVLVALSSIAKATSLEVSWNLYTSVFLLDYLTYFWD